MNPASVMKLVTTYAATRAARTRLPLEDRGVPGRRRRGAQGLRRPEAQPGELLDAAAQPARPRAARHPRRSRARSVATSARVANGRIDDDSFRPYNVVPDALLVNFKSLRFSFVPADPAVRVYRRAGASRAGGGQYAEAERGRVPRGPRLSARSSRPSSSRSRRAPRSPAPTRWSAARRSSTSRSTSRRTTSPAMVKQLWAEMGGSWDGVVRQGGASPGARLVYVHESEPLARGRARHQQVLEQRDGAPALPHARGRDRAARRRARKLALASIRQLLNSKGIKAPELVIENGSGLSRVERMSAGTIAARAAGGVAKRGDARVRLVAAGGRRRRHHEEAPARRARRRAARTSRPGCCRTCARSPATCSTATGGAIVVVMM